MKKQALTKQDIQKELLTKLNKRKSISIFLTAIVIIGIILYPIHLINYLDGTPLDYTGGIKSPDLTPTAAMFVLPLLIIFFVIIVFYLYYIDLYKIKKGKFEIIEDTLDHKKKELRSYYRRTEKENSLYFPCGRIAVDQEVYAYSKEGDRFYLVVLNSKKNPHLAYHINYFELKL